MKCEVVKDLLVLYTEQLCSPESVEELEKHLADCENCRKQLEHYKLEINVEKDAEKARNNVINKADIKPMKKIKKKMKHRVLVSFLLGILLVLIVTGIGVLGYGEMTNECLSFSALADGLKIKKVCESLAKGDVQPLIELLPFTMEEQYEVNNATEFEDYMVYKEKLKRDMVEAYEYHFKGKNIKVKLDYIEQFPNDYEQQYLINQWSARAVTIGFYEQGNLVYEMEFADALNGKFTVFENVEGSVPRFIANKLPYDETKMKIILKHATRNQYKDILSEKDIKFYGAGYSLMIKKWGADEEEEIAYKKMIRQNIQNLCDSGWYTKDTMFAVEGYDDVAGKWVYKIWIQMENQTDKTSCILEQKFYYYNDNLYTISNEMPVILAGNANVSKDIENQMLNLFW